MNVIISQTRFQTHILRSGIFIAKKSYRKLKFLADVFLVATL